MTGRQAAPQTVEPSHRPCRRIAILGAQSTGKSWLTHALAQSIGGAGSPLRSGHPAPQVQTVHDVLQSGGARPDQIPQAHELLAMAQAQAQAVHQAHADWVIADTTPLLTAVHSQLLFEDTRLYPMALAHHAIYEHTLLTGLDLPWAAQDLQRDLPPVRGQVDRLLRQALDQAGLRYKVVYGQGPKRLSNALMALGLHSPGTDEHSTREEAQFGLNRGRKAWQCNDCSDPDCERQLFQRLLR